MRVFDHIPIKTDGKPALFRIVINDIDHDKKRSVFLVFVNPPQGIGDAGPFVKFDGHIFLLFNILEKGVKNRFCFEWILHPAMDKIINILHVVNAPMFDSRLIVLGRFLNIVDHEFR